MTFPATASITSSAPAAAFFAHWADMAAWPEWNLDTEWVRLHGPFAPGTTGRLKPKGGFAVPFRIERLTDDEFVDVSRLPGARLTFAHRVTASPTGVRVDVRVDLTGPLAGIWRRIIGPGVSASLQPDLDRLARRAEQTAA